MATTLIAADGSITVTLSPQEQALAAMLAEDRGGDVLTEVFNLWFNNAVRDVMNTRFSRLDPLDQASLLTKMSEAKVDNARVVQ